MKIVINRCYGGFNLPDPIYTGVTLPQDYEYYNKNRHDPNLVNLVENMHPHDNHWASQLVVVEWPDDLPYKIVEYDGDESVTLDIKAFLDKHREEFMINESPICDDLVKLDKVFMKGSDYGPINPDR
jgi:hypothetical protein